MSSSYLQMAIGDFLRPGLETPQALMADIATRLQAEAEADGWPGVGIVTCVFDAEDGGALVVVEPGKGRLSVERMRAFLSSSRQKEAAA